MQIVVDGVLLKYKIIGSPNKPPFLILHGWGRSLDEWLPTACFLQEHYQVILLNLPGFGGSTNFPSKIGSIQDYSDIVKKFLQKISISTCIVLGHSFGGKIALHLASTNYPIKKLFLISPSGVESKSLFIYIKLFLVKIFKPLLFLFPENVKVILNNKFSSKDYQNAGKLKESFKNIVKQNLIKEVVTINCETIIIWGENDKELPINQGIKLKILVNNSTLRVVWGSGHFPHIEKKETFLQLLQEYI